MSSKAYYKSSVAPKLLHRWFHPNSSSPPKAIVEIWTTTCIVTNFGRKANCSILINPSNPQLSGVRNFPYFPRGGPVPKERPMSMHKDWQPLGYVSQWGGMEVGNGMLYPVSVVDGLVHQMGGWQLEAACRWKQTMASVVRNTDACPVGQAVMTPSGGTLGQHYDHIIHTTPPFYDCKEEEEGDSVRDALYECYRNALILALARNSRVATPLLGAGARGFPESVAIDVAAQACSDWCCEGAMGQEEKVVAFGLLEESLADDLIAALEQHAPTRQ